MVTAPGKRGRRSLKIAAAVIAAVLVAGVVFASVRLDAIVNAVKDRQVAALAKKLWRSVTVGRVSTHLVPLSVDVVDVTIGADPKRPAEKLPVLSLARVHVGVASKTICIHRIHRNSAREHP